MKKERTDKKVACKAKDIFGEVGLGGGRPSKEVKEKKLKEKKDKKEERKRNNMAAANETEFEACRDENVISDVKKGFKRFFGSS